MDILIAYGTKRGGVAGIADVLADELRRLGATVEVHPARSVRRIDDHVDAVIVGGALYMNRWHRDARRFVRRHADALRDRRVWTFSSGPLDDSATAGDIAPVPQVAALLRLVDAHGHTTFGGRLEADARGFIASKMARNTAGDWREPSHIREWAAQIADQLDPQRR